MQAELPFTSGTPIEIEASFPELDIATARVVVRNYIALGLRKGPSELLVLSDRAYDEWLTGEAIKFLKEQKARRQAVVAEAP